MTEDKPTKIAVLRCDIVSETCPGSGCLNAFNGRRVKFADYGDNTDLIAVFTCGGCSGRRVFRLVRSLKKHNIDFIHLSSCMQTKSYPACPHIDSIKKTIIDAGIGVVEGTHH